ncbi:LuxR C-terminal-related transcriptional regulator [uncultured Prevotella sp.]|uniref:response regulator transcription factor n=1 Tax=uncultured Prevotella sp. TaxID=159272 RepID=UPI00262A73C3|nr:LuxR C-terminal-related transcriptional regulator [uncultured Prevotella sp.]
MFQKIPQISIVDSNTLAAIGLKGILQSIIPMMSVEIFSSTEELMNAQPDKFYHYFVSSEMIGQNKDFYLKNIRKTILLTKSTTDIDKQYTGFHYLYIDKKEKELLKSLLWLEQMAHSEGRHLPPTHFTKHKQILSDREAEVMSLIVKGMINKEIADKLHIGLSTVITHRRNIMEKLHVKSVSALTIYAVINGYVNINDI